MRLMVFPAAFMANTFAMMLVMIGLSLFGKPEIAADFGLVHGATVALFYSFSGNARSLILGTEGLSYSAQILRIRLLMVVPLGALSWVLCTGVVEGGGLFVLTLVLRRAAEWVAEIFLSEEEVHQHGVRAMRFLIAQGVFGALLLVALLDGNWLALPVTLLWAASPLLGCLNLSLFERALARNMPVLSGMRALLPHIGSTAVIGVSVYVFRLFLVLVAGKEAAGDLFSAFALGGLLGAVFSQALGPSMVRQEQAALGSTKLVRFFNGMLFGLVMAGLLLGVLVWSLPGLMGWTLKSDFFWLGVACSLVGGGVMVQAQRIRLRIIQGEGQGDVFGSDILANVLLVASVPFLYFGVGVESLTVLYLLSALYSLFFYMSERSGLLKLKETRLFSEKFLLVVISFLIMLPMFFQLSGGLFVDPAVYFNSGGQLSLVPIPISVAVCFFGIILLGRYNDARLALVTIFFLFVGMLLVSLLKGEDRKLILLIQFVLPFFALVLGQQYGKRPLALQCMARSGAFMLSVVVPLQLLSTWLAGGGHLMPSVFLFSIYQHFQYVPVVFVGIFLVCLFTLAERWAAIWMIVLGGCIGIYTVISLSLLAQIFLVLGLLGFALRGMLERRPLISLLMAAAVTFGIAIGGALISESPFTNYKYSAVGGERQAKGDGAFEVIPIKTVHESEEIWRFYANKVSHNWESFLLGHVETLDRNSYSSAHNYYLDFAYNFGVIGMFPFLVLLFYTLCIIALRFKQVWARTDLLGLTGVLIFFLLVDNFLKVGLRQPYPGILMFFFWGVLLSILTSRPNLAAVQEKIAGH